MDTNYITPKELREIARACDSLVPLWNTLTNTKDVSFEMLEGPNIVVYDSNGEILGNITWCDDGAAFYPAGSDG